MSTIKLFKLANTFKIYFIFTFKMKTIIFKNTYSVFYLLDYNIDYLVQNNTVYSMKFRVASGAFLMYNKL